MKRLRSFVEGAETDGDSLAAAVPAVLVHLGTAKEGAEFLKMRWPAARAVADPGKTAYTALGLGRAKLNQVFGLRVWKAAFPVARLGVGKPVGDPLALGGSFLVQGTRNGVRVLASDVAEHAGDLPDYAGLVALATGSGGAV